jgi:geranylgeranyl diphosphate synthase type I
MEKIIHKINRAIDLLFADIDRRYGLKAISAPLFDCSRDFVLRPGKRIRPLLFILAYKGYSARKTCPENKLYTAAASIELLHDYMLIHDDVIDNSDLRRGKPTLHRMLDEKIRLPGNAAIGNALAIIAGDIIFAIAIESFLTVKEDAARKEKTLAKLVETAAYTGAGEFIDVVWGHQTIDKIKEKDILLTYILKTAKYTFECPLLMGALLAGAGPEEQKKISALGLSAGQAFQIYDDFLDLFATADVIGKPVLTDLAESKKTLLVFRAFKFLRGARKAELRRILEKKSKNTLDLERFKKLVVSSGAYESCYNEMAALQNKALASCRSLSMKKEFRGLVESLIAKLSPKNMPIKL